MRHPVVGPDADLLLPRVGRIPDAPRPETTLPSTTRAPLRPPCPDARHVPRHGRTATAPVHGPVVEAPSPRGPAVSTAGPLAKALRHLLRSAARSVVASAGTGPGAGGRIRLTSAGPAAPLVVRDDGAGLTGIEVRGLLAASVSGTELVATVAPEQGDADLDAAVRACLEIADVVEIRSRSSAFPDAAVLSATIHADGRVRVALGGATLTEPGTEVRLSLRSEYRTAAGPHLLPGLVRDLADQLAVPVEVDGTRVPTSGPPAALPDLARRAWCRDRLGVEPVAVLPLGDGPLGSEAVAVILPEPGTGDTGAHRVVVDGVRISDVAADLLPEWAGFCRVVLEAGSLPLTADGDALAPGPELDDLRAHLARALLGALIRLEAYEPEVFRRVTRLHEDALVQAVGRHRRELDLVRGALTVPTSLGPRTLEDFRGVVGVVACAAGDTWPVIGPAAARAGVLVVDVRDPGVLRLLETLGTAGPSLAVLGLGDLRSLGLVAA